MAEDNTFKLAKSAVNFMNNFNATNPWSTEDIDKLESPDSVKEYRKTIEACRFFYRRDPLASTIVNKMIDIGINDLTFKKNGLSDNEFRVFTSIKDKLLEFSENLALEFLLSGMVVPEISYGAVGKEELKQYGIKKYETLVLPTSMWVRDPSTLVLNKGMVSDKPSVFVEIPDDLVYFIMNKGKYPDGTRDDKLYQQMKVNYPEFVMAVEQGSRKMLLENNLILRRRVLSNTAYPIPYLYPAIEPLKHKRNLRRMDYAIASRVIGAIMLVKLGDKDFPLTEDNSKQLDDVRKQMLWRDGTGKNVERIFQLFSNHTLNIEWVMPDIAALINDAKYKEVNQDIIFALGFPRVLITGESEKSNTSDPQFAAISPSMTLNNFRSKIEIVLRSIVDEIATRNKFKTSPTIQFAPLQLIEFKTFVDGLQKLYEGGNISRESMSDFFGYSFYDELEKREEEQKALVTSKVPEFAPTAHSQNPQMGNTPQSDKQPADNKPDNPAKPSGNAG